MRRDELEFKRINTDNLQGFLFFFKKKNIFPNQNEIWNCENVPFFEDSK